MTKSKNKIRRICMVCKKKVTLKLIETPEGLILKCPNCFAQKDDNKLDERRNKYKFKR